LYDCARNGSYAYGNYKKQNFRVDFRTKTAKCKPTLNLPAGTEIAEVAKRN